MPNAIKFGIYEYTASSIQQILTLCNFCERVISIAGNYSQRAKYLCLLLITLVDELFIATILESVWQL